MREGVNDASSATETDLGAGTSSSAKLRYGVQTGRLVSDLWNIAIRGNIRTALWRVRRLRMRTRGLLLSRLGRLIYFRSCRSSLLTEGPVWFRQFWSDIRIGSGVRLDRRITFDVNETATLVICYR